MLTSASPSPSVSSQSPARAHRSPRLFASPHSHPSPKSLASRVDTAQTRPADSSHRAASATVAAAAITTIATATTTKSPRAPTADSGTQYTPPDWPPTDARSSIHHRKTTCIPASAAGASVGNPPPTIAIDNPPQPPRQELATVPIPSAPPTEPLVRITPSISLKNVAAASRSRPRSSTSTSRTPSQNNSALGSPSKRNKQDASGTPLTALPADYAACDTKVLASIIASMLLRLITHNDSIPLKDGQLTRFHSRTPPGISVHDYLQRLTFHATLLPPILLSMVFFIDRLSAKFPTFIINSLTVHRFLITAATVASKGLSDSFWTNSTYARVGGVSVKELALLELELLMKAEWKIVPTNEDLKGYYRGLVEGCEGYVIEGQEMEVEDEGFKDDTGHDHDTGHDRGTRDVKHKSAAVSEQSSSSGSASDDSVMSE